MARGDGASEASGAAAGFGREVGNDARRDGGGSFHGEGGDPFAVAGGWSMRRCDVVRGSGNLRRSRRLSESAFEDGEEHAKEEIDRGDDEGAAVVGD